MKKTFLFSALALLLPAFAHSQTMQQADNWYDKHNYTEAYQAYQQIAQTAKGSEMYKAQLRMIASQYNLGQYLEAAKTAHQLTLPVNNIAKARLLLYRIQTAQMMKTYSARLNNAEEQNPQGANIDLEKLTPQQWQNKINNDFEALWDLRNQLINESVEKETLILNIEDTDLLRIPTLFDVVVNMWKEDLAKQRVFPVVPAERFISSDFKTPEQIKNNMDKLAGILEIAAQLNGKNRDDAKVFWQTERILLPFDYSANFAFTDEDSSRVEAIRLLNMISGYTPVKKSFFSKLKGLVSSDNSDYGRSYAAYRSAQLLEAIEDYPEALKVCAFSAEKFGDNFYTEACARLSEKIQTPVLEVKNQLQNQNPKAAKIKVRARNTEEVYVRLYPVSPAELKKMYLAEYNSSNSWRYLSSITSKNISKILTDKNPTKEFVGKVNYLKPYSFRDIDINLPELSKGFYVVLLSYDKAFTEENKVYSVVLNLTDLALVVTSSIDGAPSAYQVQLGQKERKLNPGIFRIYSINLQNGRAEANTDLEIITQWKGTKEKAKTDASGLLSLKRSVTVGENRKSSSHFINPLGIKNGNYAFLENPVYFHFYPNQPVKMFLETDRVIYRGGQKVYYSVNVFENAPRGLKTMNAGQTIEFTFRDPNYAVVHTAKVKLNDFGTAAGEFTLPQDGLLGFYPIQASLKIRGNTYSAHGNIQVDDYKRPDYKVTLADTKSTPEYGKELVVEGSADYYFGAPLEKATVKYTVEKIHYVPTFYWWWSRIIRTEPEFIAGGETQTTDKGKFKIAFTPVESKGQEAPSSYTVTVEVYDESGRVIKETKSYKVSRKPNFFNVEFNQGFYDAEQAGQLATLKLLDINAKPVEGKVTAEIYQLENALYPQEEENENVYYPNYPQNKPALEKLYAKNAELKRVTVQDLDFKKEPKLNLNLPALPEGIYKLVLKNSKADTQGLIFIVASDQPKLALPEITLAQHDKYYPGNNAKILLGAGELTGKKYIEVYTDGQFLARTALADGGLTVYQFPVTVQNRGGMGLRWFAASNYKIFSGQADIQVPFDNKKLNVVIKNEKAVKPGQKVTWSLEAKDATGSLVQGQASVAVYDKSLDYYAKKNAPFTLESLFPMSSDYREFRSSLAAVYATVWGDAYKNDYVAPPLLPQLNLSLQYRGYGRMARGVSFLAASKSLPEMEIAYDAAAAPAPTGAMAKQAANTIATEESAENADTGGAEGEAPVIRTDFSETAYFNSKIPLNGGKGSFSFTMPESLTAWNIMAFAITKTADFGQYTAQTVTQKDFMVRLQMPRFYREGDKGVIQAALNNLTDKKISGEITLSLTEDGKNVADKYGVTKLKRNFTVSANGTSNLSWDIAIPQGTGVLDVTAVARAGKESDGETKQLPVLPSRARLMASNHVAIDTGTVSLNLSELQNEDPTRQVETAVLLLDPSLVLSVVNAMPKLLEPKYKDIASTIDRYVPLAVLNQFYTKYPEMRKAVAKLPKRNTQNPAWDDSDPLRLTLLSETPWLQLSKGGREDIDVVADIFNPSAVKKQEKATLSALKKYQNNSGAFTWLPGGPDSDYLTLYVLDAYSEAVRFGVDVPKDSAEKAIQYIVKKIEKNLKDGDANPGSIALSLYASYVLTAFPQDWASVKEARSYVSLWINFADKYTQFMTPLGQTYAASVYHRLGNKAKADSYLDLVLSQMKIDPLTGAYFAPEKYSWLWYQDTLTKQTAVLRVLTEIRPDSARAADVVKWLLFNRKATSWDSTTATSKAVFALLDYMQAKGLLAASSTYTITWGDLKETRTLTPFDWQEKLSYTKTENLTDSDYHASIQKEGGLTAFASLFAVYSTNNAQPSAQGVINVNRKYFLRYTEDGVSKLKPLLNLAEVKIGDEVEVQLDISADSAFDYVLLSDPKPAGFESDALLSGWNWNTLNMYRENRDSVTNFFINAVPAGSYTIKYTLRPTVSGVFNILPAQLQSMYSPEFGAHSGVLQLKVK